MSAGLRCPELYSPEPCTVGICSDSLGDIVATNVVGGVFCLFSPTPIDYFVEHSCCPELVAASLYSVYNRYRYGVVHGGMGHLSPRDQYRVVVFRVPLWRKLLSLFKPVKVYGYKWDGRSHRWERCVFYIRWLPRRRVVMRSSSI